MADGSGRGEPSHPMIKFAGDIAACATGIRNLEKGQEEVDSKVSGLHHQMNNMVTKPDCKDHREVLCKKMDAKFGPEEVEEKPSWLERWGKKAGALMAILTLVVFVGGGLLLLSRFVGKVETAMATVEKDRAAQQKAMMKKLREPLVVPMPGPVQYLRPDASVRPRRRYRRRPHRRRVVPNP